jgi:hypothetical protein
MPGRRCRSACRPVPWCRPASPTASTGAGVMVLSGVLSATGLAILYVAWIGAVTVAKPALVVTQHAWRANLRGSTSVEVTHAGRREAMHAQLDEEVGAVVTTLQNVIKRIGWQDAQRTLRLATDAGRPPTSAELAEAVRDYHLATITLTAV